MTTIYLVRHAEAEGNLYRRIHGWYDSLVTENGKKQLEALRRRFEGVPVDEVYSSDLCRTRATARAVSVPKGLTLRCDPALREMCLGDWEDDTWGAVRHRAPAELERFNSTDPDWSGPPGGESFPQLTERVSGALRRIAQENPGRTVAVFSHGMAIRQCVSFVKGTAPGEWKHQRHGDNTCVTCLAWDGEKFHLVYELDNSHLDDAISTLARQSWWRKDGKRPEDVNLWFRPLDVKTQTAFYWRVCAELWGDRAQPGIGTAYCALRGDEPVGLMELDFARFAGERTGYVPLCYLVPQARGMGLGIQLVGQAVSAFRARELNRLRLCCLPDDGSAGRFFRKYGFEKNGGGEENGVLMDFWEKYIGYDL